MVPFMIQEMQTILHSCGVRHPHLLGRKHVKDYPGEQTVAAYGWAASSTDWRAASRSHWRVLKSKLPSIVGFTIRK